MEPNPYHVVYDQNAERFSERIGTVAEKLKQCADMEHGAGHLGAYIGDPYSREESGLTKSAQSR